MLIKKQRGFGLLELVITLGIIAILYAICVPGLHKPINTIHRQAAELKLLSWQASDERPLADPYYSYRNLKIGNQMLWSATSKQDKGDCQELYLRNESHGPAGCWPST